MAALPSFADEAGMRALDAKCQSPSSNDSTRTVVQLGKLPLADRKKYLHNAAIWDLACVVRCVLQEVSADVRSGGEYNETALCVAAAHGSERVLRVLLDGGANHALSGSQGIPALSRAARPGHLSCLRFLVDAGADPSASDVLGNTPLIDAVMEKHAECARVLAAVSDLLQTNRAGRNAVHVSVHTASEACFELLLPLMENVDVRTVQGVDEHGVPISVFNETSLHLASAKGQMAMARALLKRGADRMARDNSQYSPLHCAAQMGALSCVILLVGRPEKPSLTPDEVNSTNKDGCTALHCAAINAHEKICGVLLAAGALLDAKDSSGFTPLQFAQLTHPENAALLELLSGRGPANPPGTVCDHCGKPASAVRKMLACGVCQLVRYCSSACQVAAWKGHKKACAAEKAVREKRTAPRTVKRGASAV